MGIKIKKLYVPPLMTESEREEELQDKVRRLQEALDKKEIPEVVEISSVADSGKSKSKKR